MSTERRNTRVFVREYHYKIMICVQNTAENIITEDVTLYSIARLERAS